MSSFSLGSRLSSSVTLNATGTANIQTHIQVTYVTLIHANSPKTLHEMRVKDMARLASLACFTCISMFFIHLFMYKKRNFKII